MSRKQSREIAFKLLFSLCFENAESSVEAVIDEKPDEKELAFIFVTLFPIVNVFREALPLKGLPS